MLRHVVFFALSAFLLLASVVLSSPVPASIGSTSLTAGYKRQVTGTVCARVDLYVEVNERACSGVLGTDCNETGAKMNVTLATG